MVFIHHYKPFPGSLVGKGVFNFLREFHTGVSLFFVLSGFLIAFRYYDGSLNFKKYIINRVARIYPVYFILTTATFLVAAFVYSDDDSLNSLSVYVLNITFLKGYFESFKFSGIAQGWSLTVEETFYFLAPVIFVLIKRNKLWLFIAPLVIIVTGVLLVQLCRNVHFGGLMSSNEFMFNYTFFGRCCEFFTGIGLAIFFKQKAPTFKTKYATYTGLLIIILCIFGISLLKGNYDFGIRTPAGKFINTFIMPLAGIAVFYYGLLTEKTFISTILGSSFFVVLGKSSYVFYLIHMGVIVFLLNKVTSNNLILFLLLNIIAVLVFKYIEEPLNNFIRAKFSRDVTATPALQTSN